MDVELEDLMEVELDELVNDDVEVFEVEVVDEADNEDEV